jgi:two-component system, OmpR family, phosphate regulon sensor histidine kinase PhoR
MRYGVVNTCYSEVNISIVSSFVLIFERMKKLKINKSLIYSTFAFLLILLVVQIIWTNQVAQLEERLFNDRVELALVSVKADLEDDAIASESMKESMKERQHRSPQQTADIKTQNKRRLQRVDQLLKRNLLLYNIKLSYDFELINNKEAARQKARSIVNKGWYYTPMENILVDEGIQLKLKFPSRDQFLLSKLFGMFLISFFLILAVTVSFIIMLRLYRREHLLAQRTKDFVNNMTHELKTPLSNISLAGNLAQKQLTQVDNEKLSHYLHIIDTEKSKLQTLADDILTVAVLENVPSNGGFEKVDMHALITTVAQDSFLAVDDKKGVLKLHLLANSYLVSGNQKRLMNVLTNLIDNALKYNINDPVLTIDTQNRNNQFVFTVKDNGIGIRKEDLRHILEKYYRVSTGNVHNAKGFGLGLTFVKLVIDEHHGTLKMKSKPEQGTEIEISLPTIS